MKLLIFLLMTLSITSVSFWEQSLPGTFCENNESRLQLEGSCFLCIKHQWTLVSCRTDPTSPYIPEDPGPVDMSDIEKICMVRLLKFQ